MPDAVAAPAEAGTQSPSPVETSSAASPPLNAASASTPIEASHTDEKLLLYSQSMRIRITLGDNDYDAVKYAWSQCKMDGHVLSQNKSQQLPSSTKAPSDSALAPVGTTTSKEPTGSTSNERAARPKRGIDSTEGEQEGPQSTKRKARGGKRPKVTTIVLDGSDESESDYSDYTDGDEEDTDFEAEEDLQSKRAKEAERHRQYVIDSNLIKLTHYATKKRDVEWALNAILHFASIAPGEPIAILRSIVKALSGTNKVAHGGSIGEVQGPLQELNEAADLYFESQENPTQTFIRAFNIAVAYRVVSRKKHRNEDVGDMEKQAEELLKLRDLGHAHKLGVKVLTLAFAISPRNMIGVLLLPHFGLDVSALQNLSEGKLVALVGLLTSNHWTLEQMGITKKHEGIVEFITNRLIPGIEASLLANLTSENDLHPNLRNLIVRDTYIDEKWGFGLKITKGPISSAVKREAEPVVRMPDLYLIDGSFKTSKQDRYKQEYIISICRNKVHLDKDFLDAKVHPTETISAAVFKGWIQYLQYWKVHQPASNVAPFNEVVKMCSEVEDITQASWDRVNRYITFWGTLLCKCPNHLRVNHYNMHSSVLGVLSTSELE